MCIFVRLIRKSQLPYYENPIIHALRYLELVGAVGGDAGASVESLPKSRHGVRNG